MVLDFNPEGVAQETLFAVLVSASWRIRRCGLVEAGLAPASSLDPMQDDSCSGLQNSVDRARSRAFSLFHRAMADLRRLQTDKPTRVERLAVPQLSAPELGNHGWVPRALRDSARILATQKNHRPGSIKSIPGLAESPAPAEPAAPSAAGTDQDASSASFCNEPPAVPRSAPCPCGSGEKYKRCCGKNAPPVLGKVA